MTCFAWRNPPFSVLGEENQEGVGGGRRAFLPAAALRLARRPPAPLPPGHGRGTTDSCRAAIWGVTTPRCCNLFFSELGGCRGLCYCPPSGSPVGRSGVHVRPVGARRNRQSWWWLDCARSVKWLLNGNDEAWWVHRSSGYHLSLLMVTTEQYRRSGHGIFIAGSDVQRLSRRSLRDSGRCLTQLRGSVPKADIFSIYKASPMALWDIGYILDSAHRTKTVVWRCRGGFNKRHQPPAWFPKC